jgi:hypothetical protein
MRQTAERALAEAVDTSAVQPYFVGNAPAGHVELGEAGTLFFHRCAAGGRLILYRVHSLLCSKACQAAGLGRQEPA